MSTQTLSGISVRMKDSRMKAVLIIPPNMVREAVSADLCISAARNAEVVCSEHVIQAIEKAVAQYHEDNRQRLEVVIATGKMPVNGEDGWIEWEPRL
ncbi:MAG: hypothetical protein HND57_01345 [Planctomycetes bacterium]|nr:hypothetical protein [Planctomycetota bacterium]